MSTEYNVQTTVEELLKILATKNIVGEPIEMEDKILIPITKFGVGFGAGIGEGSSDKGQGGKGGGAGGGAGVDPVALIVILKGVAGAEGIKVLHLAAPSSLAKSISEIAPAILEKMTEKKKSSK